MTPDVRVLRGEPDDVELAALVAGLVAAAQGATPGSAGATAGGAPDHAAAGARRWRDAVRPGRHQPGPDAWRWSARG